MEDLTKQIQILKEYGLNDNKIMVLLTLAIEEYIEDVSIDLEDANDTDLARLEQEISVVKEKTLSEEEAGQTLKDVLSKIYGMSSESKLNTFLSQYMDDCIEQAKQTKDFVSKVQANDPEALKQVIMAQNSPDYEDAKSAYDAASQLD